MSEVVSEVKRQIYEQEKQLWERTRESFLLKHRVYIRLKNDKAAEELVKELENCEIAIDECNKAIAELPVVPPKPEG